MSGRATGGGEEARRQRLAAALRENLKRRKAQSRGRSADATTSAGDAPADGTTFTGGTTAADASTAADGAGASDPTIAVDATAPVDAVSAGDAAAGAGAATAARIGGPPVGAASDAGRSDAAAPDDTENDVPPDLAMPFDAATGAALSADAKPAAVPPNGVLPAAVPRDVAGDGVPSDDGSSDDTVWRVRLVAAELEAERIAALIERAVEAEGWPVTRYEVPPASSASAPAASGIVAASSAAGRSVAVEAGAGAPAFAARLKRDEEWPWAVEVLVFGGGAAAAQARILDAVGGDGFGSVITVEPLADEDWVAKSLEGLPPVREGRFLVRGRHARGGEPAGIVAIDIEAGLAFGTGHHATTVGCLAAIERALARRRPRRPLDLGTGTGVLAIAIARLAKVQVVASDIDPVAVRVAAGNARGNGVGPFVRPFAATGLADRRLARGGFDLVVANILARPLERLAPAIGRSLARRATVVLSGLRVPDGRRVEAAYRRQGLVLTRRDARDGWLTLTFERQ